jgi:hypothetical protein
MSDLQRKSRWAGEAIGPAQSTLHRSLNDLPTDVTPGARQVAELTSWRMAQEYQVERIAAALDVLEKLPDWQGGFLVCNSINFDWHNPVSAPFRHYASFNDFFDTELRETWEAWDRLHRRYLRRE